MLFIFGFTCNKDQYINQGLSPEIQQSCKGKLVNLDVGPDVTQIPSGFFLEFFTLKSVIIRGETEICNAAFYSCYFLSYVELSSNCFFSGEKHFSERRTSIYFVVPKENTRVSFDTECLYSNIEGFETLIFMNLNYSGHYSLPESIFRIGSLGCYQCANLSSLTLHSRVTYLGSSFLCAPNIDIIKVPFSNALFHLSTPTMLVFNSTVFWFKKTNLSITFPEGITNFDWNSFVSSRLEKAVFPSTLIHLQGQTVKGLRNSILIFKEGVQRIDSLAFIGSSLRRIVFEGPINKIALPESFSSDGIRLIVIRCEDEWNSSYPQNIRILHRCPHTALVHLKQRKLLNLFFLF